VPWCTDCARFLSPSTVSADGTCPTCGRLVEAGDVATRPVGDRTDRSDDAEEDLAPIPWHLKFLASGIAIYLAYRLYQGIVWVIG
jgi:hypothetical protein